MSLLDDESNRLILAAHLYNRTMPIEQAKMTYTIKASSQDWVNEERLSILTRELFGRLTTGFHLLTEVDMLPHQRVAASRALLADLDLTVLGSFPGLNALYVGCNEILHLIETASAADDIRAKEFELCSTFSDTGLSLCRMGITHVTAVGTMTAPYSIDSIRFNLTEASLLDPKQAVVWITAEFEGEAHGVDPALPAAELIRNKLGKIGDVALTIPAEFIPAVYIGLNDVSRALEDEAAVIR